MGASMAVLLIQARPRPSTMMEFGLVTGLRGYPLAGERRVPSFANSETALL